MLLVMRKLLSKLYGFPRFLWQGLHVKKGGACAKTCLCQRGLPISLDLEGEAILFFSYILWLKFDPLHNQKLQFSIRD